MKTEIAEQAIASYLKNCEFCTNVQTNWTVSRVAIQNMNLTTANTVMQKIVQTVQTPSLFGNNRIKQLLAQAEVDVVGLKDIRSSSASVYLVDTAFHEDGLHYKNTTETVVKKLVRASMLADLFYPGFSANVWFISPKADQNQVNAIKGVLSKVMPIIISYYPKVKIQLIVNDDFSQLIENLVGQSASVHDSNDLFMRAVKLLKLTNIICTHANSVKVTQKQLSKSSNNKTIVIDTFNGLLSNGKLSTQILADLTDKSYSSKTFRISSYSVLIKVDALNNDLKKRYYTYPFFANGEEYRICSQWGQNSITKLKEWENKL